MELGPNEGAGRKRNGKTWINDDSGRACEGAIGRTQNWPQPYSGKAELRMEREKSRKKIAEKPELRGAPNEKS